MAQYNFFVKSVMKRVEEIQREVEEETTVNYSVKREFYVRPDERELFKRILRNRELLTTVPVALSRLFVDCEEFRERQLRLLERYSLHWQRACANFGVETPMVCSLRTWDRNETFEDSTEWRACGKKRMCFDPLFVLTRPDAEWVLAYGDKRIWAPSHFFESKWEIDEQIEEYGFVRYSRKTGRAKKTRFSRYSPVCALLDLMSRNRTAKSVDARRKQLFVDIALKELSELRKDSEFLRSRYTHVGCLVCLRRKVLACGFCRTHCACVTHGKFHELRRRRSYERRGEVYEGREQMFTVNHKHSVEMPSVENIAGHLIAALGGQVDEVVQRFIIGLPICVAQMWRHRSWCDWLLAITALVNSLGLATPTVSWMVNRLKGVYKMVLHAVSGDENFSLTSDDNVWDRFKKLVGKQQDATEVIPDNLHMGACVGVVGGLITVCLAAIGCKSVPAENKQFLGFLQKFAMLGRCIDSVSKLESVGKTFAEYIERLVRVYIFKQDPRRFVQNFEMKQWCVEAEKFVNTNFEQNVKYNIEVKTKIDVLLQRASVIARRLDMLKVSATERIHFNKMYDVMLRFRSTVAMSGAGFATLRPNPVVVHLVGDSGAGKSSIVWSLVYTILARMGLTDFESASQAVYFRRAGGASGYWDGFHNGVKIVVVDDIFTARDSASNPNVEVDEAIQMANNAYWAVPMADLSDKGNTHFTAPLVIWTSNRTSFDFPSRTNPEAVKSRVQLKYKVEPREEFAEHVTVDGQDVLRLDKKKVEEALAGNRKNSEFVQFHTLGPYADDEVTLKTSLFEGVVNEIWESMQGNDSRFMKMQSGLVEVFKDEVKRIAQQQSAGSECNCTGACVCAAFCCCDEMKCACESKKVHVDDTASHKMSYAEMARLYAQAVLGRCKAQCVKRLPRSVLDKIFPNDEEVEEAVEDSQRTREESEASRKKKKSALCVACERVVGHVIKMKYVAVRGLQNIRLPEVVLDIMTDKYYDRAWSNPMSECRVSNYVDEWVFGRYHYNPRLLLVNLAGGLSDLNWSGAAGEVNLNSAATLIDFSKCFSTSRPLTLEQRQDLVKMMIAMPKERWDWESQFLSFASDVQICERHEVVYTTTDLSLIAAAEVWLRTKQNEADFRKATYAHVKQERTISVFGAYLAWFLFMVVGVYVSCKLTSTFTRKTGAKGAVGSKKGKTEAYDRETAGRVSGKVETYDKEQAGRKAGRVESSEGKLEYIVGKMQEEEDYKHSEECYQALCEKEEVSERFLERIRAKYGEDATPAQVQQVYNEFEEDLHWECTCWTGGVQAVLDQNAREVSEIAFQNMYKLEQKVNGQWMMRMNIVFVKGRLAIANKHILARMQDKDGEWRIINTTRPAGYSFKARELSYFAPQTGDDSERDLCLFEFPRRVHLHRDIVDKFVTQEDQGRRSEYKAVCVTGHVVQNGTPIVRQYFGSAARCVDGVVELQNGQREKTGAIRRFISYPIQTVDGDCGSVVVAFDKRCSNKILGIHAGGFETGDHQGFAQPVTKEVLLSYLANIKLKVKDSIISCDPPVEGKMQCNVIGALMLPRAGFTGHIQEYGTGKTPHRHYKTKIQKSPLHGKITEPTTAPAVLGPREVDGEIVDPFAKACEKIVVKDAARVNEEFLQRSVEHLEALVNSEIDECDKRVMSFEEAVAGVEGEATYPPINRNSSAGYGWPSGKTKKAYLGSDSYVFDNEQVRDAFDMAMERLKSGKRVNAVFVDTLKDERRSLERVAQCKTRLFCAGEMIFTIIFRMYFMGWASHMMKNKVRVESCVGVNPMGSDWHKLALELKSVPGGVIAGDFSNYDGTMPVDFMWSVLDIIERFYDNATEEEKSIRRLLWSDICNSWHACGEHIVLWSQSNPSGCPVTTLLNSVVHSLLARYAFLEASSARGKQMTLVDFDRFIIHKNFGDDDLWVVQSECEWLTQDVLTRAFATIGMVYTDEAKRAAVAFRKLEEVLFLKRGFRFEKTIARYVAPLRLDVILEMPMWIHDTADVHEQTMVTLQTACRELALHPESVWNEWYPVMRKCVTHLKCADKVLPTRVETLLTLRQQEMVTSQRYWL